MKIDWGGVGNVLAGITALGIVIGSFWYIGFWQYVASTWPLAIVALIIALSLKKFYWQTEEMPFFAIWVGIYITPAFIDIFGEYTGFYDDFFVAFFILN